MKRIKLVLFGALLFLSTSCAVFAKRTFRGEIMDIQCAKMGSHDVMIKKVGARNRGECTRDCSQMGGKYVLYYPSTKTAYQLDGQKNFEPFVGQTVDVMGTYDGPANQIHVAGIERVSAASLSLRK